MLTQEEGRIDLVRSAYVSGQFTSVRRADAAYSVRHQPLSDQLREIAPRQQTRPNCQKLTITEERTVVRYILDLDARGFAPRLSEVADMADQILEARGGTKVGKNWPARLVSRTEELKMAFSRAKDRQRILQEDLEVIRGWFELVRGTIEKYGVQAEDIHNFDETGYQDFKDYCLEQKILTLCMPAHSSHILQPLDVVCFSPLKLKYSQRVRDLARRRVYHINKEGFLPAFKDAFLDVFTYDNCKKAFEAAEIVPLNAERVLDRLEVQLRTPSPVPLPGTPWQSQTPSNPLEFSSQSKLVRESLVRSPTSAQESFSKLVKGAEEMLHENVLIKARVRALQEQLAVMTKRKSRKRKRIQQGGTMEYGTAAAQVAAEASTASRMVKKARSSGGAEQVQPTQRRCGICGDTGHNARTCQKGQEPASEPDAGILYENLDVDNE